MLSQEHHSLEKKEEADLFYVGSLNIHQAKKREKEEKLQRLWWLKHKERIFKKRKVLKLHLQHLV